jgi:hypothetical protein
MEASQFAPPVIIRTAENHSASVCLAILKFLNMNYFFQLIFFHGLGDQGDGWAE